MDRRIRLRMSAVPCLVVLICLARAVTASAQTSELVGTVVDTSGAVVPGATVTITQVSTGALRTAISNEAGQFRVPALDPGQYRVAVELQGFKRVTMSAINLQSSETRDIGRFAMEVGAQTENVTVTAEVTPVQLASAERSASINGDQLENIQLKGRDLMGFASLTPGVLDTNNARDYTTYSSMAGISINGALSTTKNVTVDGFSMVDEGSSGSIFVNVNMDAVSEVKVLSNGYQAEFGRNSGGTISVITKSGSDSLRGSGWYNGRRDKFNATPYLNQIQGQGKPKYDINIEGYSIGGKVPQQISSHKVKLFFFASQEYTKDTSGRGTSGGNPEGLPVVANLPTAAERTGDFSQTFATNGSLIPIIDPLTGKQFPANIIPANRIDPTGQALLNLLPMPNGYVNPLPGQQYTANTYSQLTPIHIRLDQVYRVDANFTEQTSAYFKYMRDRDDFTSFNAIAPGFGANTNAVPGYVYSGHLSQVLSGTMVNEMTAGFGWKDFENYRPDHNEADYYCAKVGVCPPRLVPYSPTTGNPVISGQQVQGWPYVPIMTFSGGNRANLLGYYAAQSPGGGRVLPQGTRFAQGSWEDDLSKTLGRHNLKTGVYVEYSGKTEPSGTGQNYEGNFNFGSTATNPLDTGYGYANALLGVFQSYTESTNRENKDFRLWLVEPYVQDNWRLSSRMTIDVGVRLTHMGPFHDITGQNAAFFPSSYSNGVGRMYVPTCLTGVTGDQPCPAASRKAKDPLTGQIVDFGYVATMVPGSGDPTIAMKVNNNHGHYYTNPYLVPAPRFGFAWDITGDSKTALRASAGMFYNRSTSGNGYYNVPPLTQDKVIRSATIADIPNLAQSAVVSPVTGVQASGTDNRSLERAYETNVTVQRDIGFHTVVEVGYVGNFVRHSPVSKAQNYIPLNAYANPANLFNGTPISQDLLRTQYPGYGTISQTFFDQDSLDYNAMQFQVQHRLTRGLQFGAAYTLSEAHGMQGWDPYTQDQRARYYGPLPTDQRHNLSVNYSYMLPSPSGQLMRALFGEWQLSGVTKFQTGTPATPTCSSNNSGLNNIDPSLTGLGTNSITGVRCQMISNPYSGFTPGNDPATALLFNTAAFTLAQPISATVGNFGNTPIGIIRQPSWSNWDLTLAKPIALAGRLKARLQFQVYNLFNQKEFTAIGTTYTLTGPNNSVNTNTQTGKYTTQNFPRQGALTARVEW